MLFDINRVKENKIRSRESRSRSFLLKRVFGDLENRILDLPHGWECGLIEGCRKNDQKVKKSKQVARCLSSGYSKQGNQEFYLEHYENECHLCKRVALIDQIKWYFVMVISAFIILILTQYGGYNGWIEKL